MSLEETHPPKFRLIQGGRPDAITGEYAVGRGLIAAQQASWVEWIEESDTVEQARERAEIALAATEWLGVWLRSAVEYQLDTRLDQRMRDLGLSLTDGVLLDHE